MHSVDSFVVGCELAFARNVLRLAVHDMIDPVGWERPRVRVKVAEAFIWHRKFVISVAIYVFWCDAPGIVSAEFSQTGGFSENSATLTSVQQWAPPVKFVKTRWLV